MFAFRVPNPRQWSLAKQSSFLIRNNNFLGIKDKQEYIHHLKLMRNA